MKISEGQLQRIKEAAIEKWKSSQNINISADLWPVACYIEAFVDFAAQQGVKLTIQLPTRQLYQSVDDITD